MTMFDPSVDASTRLGVYLMPRIQAPEWQEMENRLKALIRDKVAKVPWLPLGWASSIEQLYTTFPDQRIMVYPALTASGSRNPLAPAFLDTTEKEQAWANLAKEMQNVVSTFANGMREKGLAEMEALNADAAFWDALYTAAKTIADAPKNIVGAAGDFASELLGTALSRFLPVLVVAGIGIVVYYNREAIGKALGGRIVKAVG